MTFQFVTGSKDTNVKLLNYKYSHCIGMYKGHQASISSLKYSPDGLWIASGDYNGNVKIWDLRIGRMIHDFGKLYKETDRQYSIFVNSMPIYFIYLLTISGTDNKITILDLENFCVISQVDTENSLITHLQFSDDGRFLYGGGKNFLGVYSVEPTRVFDTVDFKWGNVNEFVVKGNIIVSKNTYFK